MQKRLKKNFTLIAFLLLVNVVGFLSAQAYFSGTTGSTNFSTQVLLESISFNPKMVSLASKGQSPSTNFIMCCFGCFTQRSLHR
jgi:hypothetical protein